ncbi:MAG TPA: hypothetical protein VGD26_03330 [Chitinophagaceae bacterium]
METVLTFALIWAFGSAIWLAALYHVLSVRKEEFYNYLDAHQKFITLYIEVSKHNRQLVKQNQKYKHAVATTIFNPLRMSLKDCDQWYKRYDIDPTAEERESSEEEIQHFLTQDANGTRYSKAVLS